MTRFLPKLLRENVNFRRFYVGQAVSLLGDQVAAIALPLTAVLALHANPGQMGALTAAFLVPNLLFSLHVGVWIDRRGRRRRIMLACDIGRAILTATIPVVYLVGHLTWAQLYVVAFLLGTLSVAFYIAYGSVFQALVPRDDYVAAASLLNGTRGASFFAGTSLGGVLVQLVSGPMALAVDAGSFVWSAVFLGRTRAPEPPAASHENGGVKVGARWIWNNAVIRSELIGVATLNFFNYMYSALVLLYVVHSLHVAPATLGLVLGGAAVGTIGASFFTGRISRRIGVGPAFLIGCFGFTAPLMVVPAAAGPHWIVVSLLFVAELLSGVGLMMLDILAGAINAASITTSVRSRVAGAFSFVNNGVRPLGAALGGVAGTWFGVRPTLWVATAGAALIGPTFMVLSPLRHLRELPAPSPEL